MCEELFEIGLFVMCFVEIFWMFLNVNLVIRYVLSFIMVVFLGGEWGGGKYKNYY